MQYTFFNAGIPEQVNFPDDTIENIFLPLLRQLTELQKAKGRRVLVFLAAPPGAGKSTLADFLHFFSLNHPGLTEVTALGMDGFHHYQDYLLAHTVMRDGQEIAMVKIKGAPITFDLSLLKERVRALADGTATDWPVYNRLLHNPVDHAVPVTGNIVILEGNYLLLEEDGWQDLRQYADYTIKLTADEALLRKRLIARKITTGVEQAAAEAFVDFSDMVNVRTCLAETGHADLEFIVTDKGYLAAKKQVHIQ